MRAGGRVAAILTASLATLLTAGAIAAAQDGLSLTVQRADFESDGSTQVVVAVDGATGDLPASAFSVAEDGQAIDGVEVTRIEDAEEVEARNVVLLIDASGSTEGEPLDAAKAAATEFTRTVTDAGVDVGVVTFADEARLVQPPTDDVEAIVAAIAGVEADGETALFDAVLVGARTLQNLSGTRSMVVFSDGADTVENTGLDAAVTAAQTAEASVSSVALETGELDIAALERLADSTGGRLVQAANTQQLGDAFGEVATSLTNQFVLTYTSLQATGEFDLTVSVALDGAEASDTIALLSPREGVAVGEPRVIETRDPGVFADRTILLVALGLLFLGLLVVLAFVLTPTGDQRVAKTLERGLRVYRRSEGRPDRSADAGAFGRRAVQIVASVPKPEGYDEKLQVSLDRAAWPLRSSEFTTLRVLAVVTGVLVGWGLFGQLILGLVGAVAGWLVPRLVLEQRVAARKARFLTQLPDTLQLLAGSLKAGYGILQGIDTIVKETSDPTSSEFRQVLTEARLGLPLEESLEGMAERIDSDDFRWVTVAINIQRRVGGNLAELLETVAETLREREMVRRQISALSAEGRLSAVILTLLPIVLGVYMFVVNPEYIGTLFEETIGQLMILGGVALMVVGVLWMRRLIDIDV